MFGCLQLVNLKYLTLGGECGTFHLQEYIFNHKATLPQFSSNFEIHEFWQGVSSLSPCLAWIQCPVYIELENISQLWSKKNTMA